MWGMPYQVEYSYVQEPRGKSTRKVGGEFDSWPWVSD